MFNNVQTLAELSQLRGNLPKSSQILSRLRTLALEHKAGCIMQARRGRRSALTSGGAGPRAGAAGARRDRVQPRAERELRQGASCEPQRRGAAVSHFVQAHKVLSFMKTRPPPDPEVRRASVRQAHSRGAPRVQSAAKARACELFFSWLVLAPTLPSNASAIIR
jgi:hypothetical protein